jgi:hypothetical protein
MIIHLYSYLACDSSEPRRLIHEAVSESVAKSSIIPQYAGVARVPGFVSGHDFSGCSEALGGH